jgi:hypothetical protein
MPRKSSVCTVTAIGIDMGKTTLHMVGLDSFGDQPEPSPRSHRRSFAQ